MEHRLPVGTPGEPGDIPLPWGRLHFEQVCAALLADGLVAEHDVERMRFSAQGARNASEVHPLVLLSNLAGRPRRWRTDPGTPDRMAGPAHRQPLPAHRSDPGRRRCGHRAGLPTPTPAAIASCRWRWMPNGAGGHQRAAGAGVAPRPAAPDPPQHRAGGGQSARPAPLHHGVLRGDPLGAWRARRCPRRSQHHPAQLRAAGRAGPHRRRQCRRPAHRAHRRLAAAVRLRTARLGHPPGTAPRDGAHALPHRWRAAQGVRGATGGDDRRGQPHQGARPHGPGRTPAPAGRPHQDPLAGWPRSRDAPVDHAYRLRRSA